MTCVTFGEVQTTVLVKTVNITYLVVVKKTWYMRKKFSITRIEKHAWEEHFNCRFKVLLMVAHDILVAKAVHE